MSTIDSRIEKNLTKLEAQLKLWNAKLGEVMAKANVAREQAMIDSRAQLEELKGELERARSKLDEAKAAGGAKFDVLKQGVERIWSDLEDAFKKLVR